MKRCTKCGEEKTLDEFYRSHGLPTSLCKSCIKAINRNWRERNKERHTQYQVMYARARQLGLTVAEYEALDGDPGRECAICGATPGSPRNGGYRNGEKAAATKRLAIDHSHTTGRLRGFLCGHCNRALGLAGDDPVLLRKMADYLERGAEFPALGGTYVARQAISRPTSGCGGPRTSRLTPCAVEGCEKNARSAGLCGMHYRRLQVTGTTDDPELRQRMVCSVADCGEFVHGHGYCKKHERHWQAHGDPLAGPFRGAMGPCTAGDCDRDAIVKGLCMKHYDQRRRAKILVIV